MLRLLNKLTFMALIWLQSYEQSESMEGNLSIV